jgi:hypothetical protein
MSGVRVVILLILACGFSACSETDSGVNSGTSNDSVDSVPIERNQPDKESPSDAASTSLPGDGPCALTTTAEVSEVTGQVMNDGVLLVGEAGDECEWVSTESSASEDVRSPMMVTLTLGDLVPGAAQTLDEYDSPGRGVEIEGLGDDAVIVCGLAADIGPGCDSYGALIVIAGDRFVTLEMSSFAWPQDITQDQVRDGLEALARSALSRL